MNEALKRLLKDVVFLRKVRKAGKMTALYGYESGFVVHKSDKKMHYGKITLGNTSEWPPESAERSSIYLPGKREGSLHFHPEKNEASLTPSAGDLNNLANYKDSLIKSDKWMMIGIKDDLGIALLFLCPLHPVSFFETNLLFKEVELSSKEHLLSTLKEEFSIGAVIVRV